MKIIGEIIMTFAFYGAIIGTIELLPIALPITIMALRVLDYIYNKQVWEK
jgi:hypothetical protein